ncbi:MAG: PQQ-binding-like beta-propeller repeat protein, partial [Thermoanaerobaculia bacterium]|nr:PQQ-binding-like beta-propeller repeat protein [Thermoanaerobaculia bacterium]
MIRNAVRRSARLAAVLLAAVPAAAQNVDWPAFGNDPGNSKYSTLDQIGAANFADVRVAWTWESIDKDLELPSRVRPGQFKPVPVVVDGRMYLPTSVGQVVALDAGSGELLWSFNPESWQAGRPANLGFQHRGLAVWSRSGRRRVLMPTHDRRLLSLDAETGQPDPEFGDGGFVEMTKDLGREVMESRTTHSSPPAVCRDRVIVGSIVSDMATHQEAPPGFVRAYHVPTGDLAWVFHTIPQQAEEGVETWENESWRYSGNTNVWSMIAVDEELGLAYLPIGTPTNDLYGGHRLGDNLYAESLVAVDCETGEKRWHFQMVHHGLWDWDLPTAPNLVDVEVDGRPVKAVAQVTKQAFAFVFDRETGEPLWPIEERLVPPSSVPGERASPTQPFPTRPAPFDRQGVSADDLIDFTPALREEALAIAARYELAPFFTPPRLGGSGPPVIQLPSDGGGANWTGAAF